MGGTGAAGSSSRTLSSQNQKPLMTYLYDLLATIFRYPAATNKTSPSPPPASTSHSRIPSEKGNQASSAVGGKAPRAPSWFSKASWGKSPSGSSNISGSISLTTARSSGNGNIQSRRTRLGAPTRSSQHHTAAGSSSPISSSPGRPAARQPHLRKKTLVLDLDETLIHSTSLSSRLQTADFRAEVHVDKHTLLYYVYKRPHVDLFLTKVGEWYNVAIFTASVKEYADPVIDFLDRGRSVVRRRLFRTACMAYHGSYIKDLRLVERDLSQVLLIDNSPTSYLIQQENGMPIEGWMNDPTDSALLELLPFLDALRFTNDVRSILSMRLLR